MRTIINGIEIRKIDEPPEPENYGEKEVYAFFGLASYTAQCLEKGLCNFAIIATFNNMRPLSQSEWDSFYNKYDKYTMGILLKTVRTLADIPESVENSLNKALDLRNDLIHNFFEINSENFMHEKGRKSMIQNLQKTITDLQIADRLLEAITFKISSKFNLTEEIVNDKVKELEDKLRNL